jgi:exodeoxyribonuclease V beta subunit
MDELTVDVESGLDVDDASFGKLRAHRRLFVESYKSVDSWSGHANESEQSNESLALDERAEPEDEALMEDEPSGPPPGQTTGLCVHELFEDLDYRRVDEATDIDEWRSHPRVSRIVESTAARYGLEEFQEELEALVWRGLTSPVETKGVSIPSIAGTDRQSMELEFWYPIPGTSAATLEELVEAPDSKPRGRGDGYLRGFIDLVFEWDGRLYIADWKTDTRRGESAYTPADVESVVDERYSIQSTFYATAAARLVARSVTSRDAFEETFGGFMYLFARGMGPGEDGASPGVYFQQPDFDELIALEKRTGEMVSNKISKHRDYIAEGRYDRWR